VFICDPVVGDVVKIAVAQLLAEAAEIYRGHGELL
jgi:hypothetical protein